MICASVGCMVKKVRQSARPISTGLGGICGVPRALRAKESTMTIRVNAVIIIKMPGATESTVNRASSCIVTDTSSGRFEPVMPRPGAQPPFSGGRGARRASPGAAATAAVP